MRLDIEKMLEADGGVPDAFSPDAFRMAADKPEPVSFPIVADASGSVLAAQETLKRFSVELASATEQANALIIKDDETNAKAVEMIAFVSNLVNSLHEATTALTKPLKEPAKKIDGFSKAIRDPLLDVKAIIQGKLNLYSHSLIVAQRAAKKKADDALALAQKAIDDQAKAAGVATIELPVMHVPDKPAAVRTELGSATIKMVWMYTVDKVADIPRDYLEKVFVLATEPMLNKVFKAAIDAGIREIPGMNIFEQAETKVRRF